MPATSAAFGKARYDRFSGQLQFPLLGTSNERISGIHLVSANESPNVRSGTAPAERTPYYRPELDALRFFAFLCVFAFHRMDYVGTYTSNSVWGLRIGTVGAFGVPVFFLLSAYLITELLMREREATGRIHVKSFYLRRILRIWPLYFTAFFGLALLNHFMPGVGSDDPHAWLAFTFFAGNWYITFHGWIAGSVDPLWSISIEEQFYIVIPLVAAFFGRKALQWTCILLLLISFGTVLRYSLHQTPQDAGEWTNSFVHFQFFATGTLLALFLRDRAPNLPLPVRAAGFALGFVCWFTALIGFHVQSWNPQPTPAGAVIGWMLVLAGASLFFLSTLGISARFVPRSLAYFGRISYALYVVHSFVFFVLFEKLGAMLHRRGILDVSSSAWLQNLGTLLVLALSLCIAHLSFRYFERPFLKLKERFTFVPSREEVNPAP